MSGHGFHVHGPHDHHVEHAAHGGDSFSGRIAVMTAILATVGAAVRLSGRRHAGAGWYTSFGVAGVGVALGMMAWLHC